MTEKRGLSGSTLKIIAIISMLTDHTAAVLVGQKLVSLGIYSVGNISPAYLSELFTQNGFETGFWYVAYQLMRRVIGRIAFPIFCFLLVEGFGRTKSRGKYLGRLFLFALLSEVPFDLAFHGASRYSAGQNVFVTLFLGLLMLCLFAKLEEMFSDEKYAADDVDEEDDKIQRNPHAFTAGNWLVFLGEIACLGLFAIISEWICCDYGAWGILAIAALYKCREFKSLQILAGSMCFLWEMPAILGFIPIAFYNGKRGLKLKYLFYAFYPVHLMILYALARMLW